LPKNVFAKTLWECKKGHQWLAVYHNIDYGKGCIYCSGLIKKIDEDYKSLAKERGFNWIGKELPKNISIKTWWKCRKGHEWLARYNDIQQGNGCPVCSNRAKKIEKDYYELAKNCGFKWVGGVLPKDNKGSTWWECGEGHRWYACYGSIQQGRRCPYCQDMINGALVSKPQRKLNNLLCGSLNHPEGKYHIDVAIMRNSQKIAVEYDARYWHEGNEDHDAKRDRYLISSGWKILHIKSKTNIPTKKQIKQVINQLLKDRDIVNLYLEDWG
jgi:very-short-patch-repair endonuclease